MVTGGITFVVMTTLKIATMGGLCLSLVTGFQYFHNYEFKPKKKEKGGDSDVSEGKSFREKAKSFS